MVQGFFWGSAIEFKAEAKKHGSLAIRIGQELS